MAQEINFWKMQAAGNDFIIIDNRKRVLKSNYSLIAKKLCQRKFSIGADGLLILDNSETADFKMLIFNSDGSQAEMCGNGARCIAYYAFVNKIAKQKMKFETLAGEIKASISGENVKIQLTQPKDIKLDFNLKIDKKIFKVSYINTGVPHTIIFVNKVDKIDVNHIGRKIRYHKFFLPKGTNVDFVQVIDKNTIFLRTYERGVEAETLACGTGCVASAIVSGLKNFVKSPVRCKTKSGEILKVYFKLADKSEVRVNNLFLEGKVYVSFLGKTII
ncbi:MAG: diaminopimelate epimerase [Endomicrobiia bacterium]